MHVGILGGGHISATHARAAAAAGCHVSAVCGQNAGKTAALAGEHGAASFSDLSHFLEHRPMDLVAIGSPSGIVAPADVPRGWRRWLRYAKNAEGFTFRKWRELCPAFGSIAGDDRTHSSPHLALSCTIQTRPGSGSV